MTDINRNDATRQELESVAVTKQEFEKSFLEGNFYNKQTQDEKHLQKILGSLTIEDGMKILDLGTGTGFLAFPLAKENPGVTVTGIDIVEQALQGNRDRAKKEQLHNLEFNAYDGWTFPFEENSFDLIVTRYALHHFPNIEHSFSEIARVLKPKGSFFLSDPAPNEEDVIKKEVRELASDNKSIYGNTGRFVDDYMQMKKDGHIQFYSKKDWEKLGKHAGLELRNCFETSIRFPKKKSTAPELDSILKKHDQKVVNSYELEIIGDEIYITERVNNICFQKR